MRARALRYTRTKNKFQDGFARRPLRRRSSAGYLAETLEWKKQSCTLIHYFVFYFLPGLEDRYIEIVFSDFLNIEINIDIITKFQYYRN